MNSYLLAVFTLLFLSACSRPDIPDSGCRACHRGLEPVSASHSSCVACHGGEGRASTKDTAHRGMFGPANPSDPAFWEKTCGSCHPYQLGRVKSSLMYTNAGIIRNIRMTWGGASSGEFSVAGGESFGPDGKLTRSMPVEDMHGLAGELYRKFCSLCHLGTEATEEYAGHGAGCAACHFPYNDMATYEGKDATMRGKAPHSASHALASLPGNEVCMRCHNRSGRIGLSYQGLLDGNNGMVPTSNGRPGPLMSSGRRNLTHIMSDAHFAAGMDCIDCHTSRDIMGDGYTYGNLYRQTEIRCEDCHGGMRAPRFREVGRENEEPVRESAHYRLPVVSGMKMALTSKGRMYSNVFWVDGNVLVLGKRSGRLFRSKVVTGTPEHQIAGHERLECHSCHSRTVVQCYGCHTTYDKRVTAPDFIRNEDTPGRFTETEDYRTLYPFPLALNERGMIAPVTPGCQTFVTVIEADGTVSRREEVARFKGKRQMRFAPLFSHNTGIRAIGCSECHGNPAFLGFGQHITAGGTISGTLLCDRTEGRPLDAFLQMKNGRVTSYSAITREDSRPLNGQEIRRVMAVNLCLICHDRANDKIYRRKLDFRALDDTVHRRLRDSLQ